MRVTFLLLFSAICYLRLSAQEQVVPLDHNPALSQSLLKTPLKTTALNLPFFEDFSGTGATPDQGKWIGASVYINNTMSFNPPSRGVATFDALNALGGPYDSSSANALVYADSLTSQPIDISGFSKADSLYLSFFYQPQGNGFAPEKQDSLILYFKRATGGWIKVWSDTGSLVKPFRQVMIPVLDSFYFHNSFQFRFVNKASINLNDDVWNIDYIRLDAGRAVSDTAVNDLAATQEPSFLLNDYTSMPYRQFIANPTFELAAQHYFTVRNNYPVTQNIDYGYSAVERESNTPLFTAPAGTAAIPGYSSQQFQFPVFPVSFTAPGPYAKVVFEQQYCISTPAGEPKANDTIRKQQVFDNYLAYDDGTAERSYFLNQFATLPAKTAIEFHLNEPDTIRGVAIYFGRQVPLASGKFFSVAVYKDIAFNGGTEQLLYQQDLLFPSYADSVNHYWVYKFDTAIAMGAGTFYLGTIQPAASGSDSLYIGLDVNRVGGNHLYFNVLNFWESSLVSGALMVRPVLGAPIFGTPVSDPPEESRWSVYPNPAHDRVQITWDDRNGRRMLEVSDALGRGVLRTELESGGSLDVSGLSPGIYFVRILDRAFGYAVKKLIVQ